MSFFMLKLVATNRLGPFCKGALSETKEGKRWNVIATSERSRVGGTRNVGGKQFLRYFSTVAMVLLGVVWASVPGIAHTPLLYIEDNDDGTIYVEGGFSDGSSAEGIPIRLEDSEGNVLWNGTLDAYGTVENLSIPDVQPYYVIFDAGPGHEVTKDGIYKADSPPLPSDLASGANPSSGVAQSAGEVIAVAASGQPKAEEALPAVTSTAAWSPGWAADIESGQGSRDCSLALWVIVGLLGLVVLQLFVIGGGMAFLAGWKIGDRS
jgi:hypothetical protein